MSVSIPLVKGCLTGASLIMAIGAQNAFVLKQGLMRNQMLATALFCGLVDALLISLGVGGLGQILTQNSLLLFIAKWGGAAFLIWYGAKAFSSAFKSNYLSTENAPNSVKPSLKQTLVILIALSFLNPHVYLDTVVLLGSIGASFGTSERPYFALGAIFASFIWFFSLCYGAKLLGPLFQKPISWKILDGLIAIMMWSIAISLILSH